MTKEEFFEFPPNVAYVIADLVGNFDASQIVLILKSGRENVLIRSRAAFGFMARHDIYKGADAESAMRAVEEAALAALELQFQFGPTAGHTMPAWLKEHPGNAGK